MYAFQFPKLQNKGSPCIKMAVFKISNRDSVGVKFYLINESSFEMPNVMFLTLDNIWIIYFWGIGRGLELGRRSIKEDLARKVDLGVVESRVHQTFFRKIVPLRKPLKIASPLSLIQSLKS